MNYTIGFSYFYNDESKAEFGKDFRRLLDDINEQIPEDFKAKIWYFDEQGGEVHIDVEIKDIEVSADKKPMVECGGTLLEFLFDYKDQHYILHMNTNHLHFWHMTFTAD